MSRGNGEGATKISTKGATKGATKVLKKGFARAGTGSNYGLLKGELESSGFPEVINCRVNQQLHECGGDDAADHGSGDAFHDIGDRAMAPENGRKTGNDDASGQGIGTDAFDRAGID